MNKLLLILLLALAASLFAASTSFAATKSHKDGVNQAAGCNTKYYHFSYVNDNNKKVSSVLKVGVCANEHYSPNFPVGRGVFLTRGYWVVQANYYTSVIGAPLNYKLDFYLNGTNNSFSSGNLTGSSTGYLDVPNDGYYSGEFSGGLWLRDVWSPGKKHPWDAYKNIYTEGPSITMK